MTGALLKADMVGLGCGILSVVTDSIFAGRKVLVPSADIVVGRNDQSAPQARVIEHLSAIHWPLYYTFVPGRFVSH